MFWENNRFYGLADKIQPYDCSQCSLGNMQSSCNHDRACHDCPVLCSCKNNSAAGAAIRQQNFSAVWKENFRQGVLVMYREFVWLSVLLWNLSVCYVTWTYKQLWKIVLHSLLAGGSRLSYLRLLPDFRNFQISTVFQVRLFKWQLLFCKKSEDQRFRCCSLCRCMMLFIFFHRLCSFCLRPMHFL